MTVPNLTDDWFSMEDAETFVANVYQGKYNKANPVDKKRVNEYARVLSKGVDEGWTQAGHSFDIDFESPDYNMLTMLRDNVFHFSAAKNRAEIQELNALLRDSKGKLRPWQEFKHEARKVTNDFQTRYLKVEYDTAVNASYLAARWNEYGENDIITFRTAADRRVRDSHKRLDGVSLPKSHPFWKVYYPPLSWNCRCTTEVRTNGKVTNEEDIAYDVIDSIPPMFRSNLAEEGIVFPKDHPYFLSLSGIVLNDQQREALQFIKTKYSTGVVYENVLLKEQNSNDYPDVLRFAHEFAQQKGGKIEMLPILEDVNILREWIYPGAKINKNPDFRINGLYADLKTLNKPSSLEYLRKKIVYCIKQGEIAVLQLIDNPNYELLELAASSKLQGEKGLRAIYIQCQNGIIYSFNKK